MHHFIMIFIIILSFVVNAIAQPERDWMRMYDDGRRESFYDLYRVADEGYIMCGWINDRMVSRDSTADIWVVRVDNDGHEIWSRTHSIAGVCDFAKSIIEADNGDFVMGGYSGGNVTALRIEEDGDQVWWRNYPSGECEAIIELKSGEFLLAGRSNSQGYLLCIQGDGDPLWEESYGEWDSNSFVAMRETEGGVVVAGHAYRRNSGWWIWVVKVNFEGDLIWSHHHAEDRVNRCYGMVSSDDGGFVITGQTSDGQHGAGHPNVDALVIKINNNGNLEWSERYNYNGPERGTCIERLPDGGYAMVGCQGTLGSQPLVIRLTPNGVERWHRLYHFDREDGFADEGHVFRSIVIGHDESILAAGRINYLEDGTFHNGLLIKLEPEILEPIVFYWWPEDSLVYALPCDTIPPGFPGDTLRFIVRARDQFGRELDYNWFFEDFLIASDTTVFLDSLFLGDYRLECRISNEEFTTIVPWNILVREMFIRSFTPDSLDLIIRRGANVDFSLDVAAIEDIELNYLWTLTDRNQRRQEVGEADSVAVCFDLAGEYRLESLVWRGEESDGVVWDVLVRSAVWYWWPCEDSLTVPVDSSILFAITPFNPDSDSLEYLWTLDGDTVEFEQEIEILFEETGLREVVVFVNDGCEADTIRWFVTVIPPVSAPEPDAGLLPTEPVLYPPAPNPFNSVVYLLFYLPEPGHVTLSIYDISGREVARLLECEMLQGEKSVVWNANDRSTGLYFVVFSAGELIRSEKLILIR